MYANKINKATSVYSGGNIYLYYAELNNGNWLMGNDEWLIEVNTNPIADDNTFEESSYCEWQEEHLVRYIHDDNFQEVLNEILEVIFNGKTIEEYNNYSIVELEHRYNKV